MYRGVLICLMTIAFVAGPMVKFGFCDRNQPLTGKPAITSVPPKVLFSAEEQLPKAKKSKGAGTYILMGVLGAALVALAAGGGGGGGSSAPSGTDSGEVEVSW